LIWASPHKKSSEIRCFFYAVGLSAPAPLRTFGASRRVRYYPSRSVAFMQDAKFYFQFVDLLLTLQLF
jgi:hypothetical protein